MKIISIRRDDKGELMMVQVSLLNANRYEGIYMEGALIYDKLFALQSFEYSNKIKLSEGDLIRSTGTLFCSSIWTVEEVTSIEIQSEPAVTVKGGHEDRRLWYFTFCSNDEERKNMYACFYGTQEETRVLMQKHFGTRWAFQYASKEDAGVDLFNLKPISVPEENTL